VGLIQSTKAPKPWSDSEGENGSGIFLVTSGFKGLERGAHLRESVCECESVNVRVGVSECESESGCESE